MNTESTQTPESLGSTHGSGLSAAQVNALRDASDILRTEANELASYMEKTLKTTLTLRTQEIVSIDAGAPHRVVIAVRREMQRLRDISNTLLGMLPEDSDND